MRRSVLLASALTFAATPAFADGIWQSAGYPNGTCGGSHFETCASVQVAWTGFAVTLTAKNLGTQTEVWKTVALANLPSGLFYNVNESVPAGRAYADLTGFTSTNNTLTGDGIPMSTYGSEADAPPTGKGLQNGEQGVWYFTFQGFSGTGGEWDIAMANATFAVHAISGPQNCSTKLFLDPETKEGVVYGLNGSGEYDPACATSVVPEPASMALLATGLVGLGGAGLIRRRRNSA